MIAKEGFTWIFPSLLFGAAFTIASVAYQSYVTYIVANVFFAIAVLMILIFRDPPRGVGRGIVSPADGRVVRVDTTSNSVTIKTGLFNVHIIRTPVSGRMMKVRKLQDKNAGSRGLKKGAETRIASRMGIFRVLQAARFPLSKFVSYGRIGKALRKGERIGIVTPMALVTAEIPQTLRITVEEGQKVKAGETSIGGMGRDWTPAVV